MAPKWLRLRAGTGLLVGRGRADPASGGVRAGRRALVIVRASASGPWTVWGYLDETLVHGWDLAVATDQNPETDPELAGAVLAAVAGVHPGRAARRLRAVRARRQFAPGRGPHRAARHWSGHARP